METIHSIEQLDEKIRHCDAARSDVERQGAFAEFRMAPVNAEGDPFSAEYRRTQMDLYGAIAGRGYDLQNEHVPFDLERASERPFPYSSESLEMVGTQLFSIGSMLRRMKLPPGARILEFGPGWGNTTVAMAQAGYNVTAVDISADFCELVRRRAEQAAVSIDVVNSDFMWAETVKEPYDAVVFFECFHHCDDHMRLLRALRSAVKNDGRIFFGGEPITDGFPVPWGVRLDGESLYVIRKHGWLELGFREDYFVEALARAGWAATKHVSHDYFGANVWEAIKAEPKITHPEVLALNADLNKLRADMLAQKEHLSAQATRIAQQEAAISQQANLIDALHNSTSWKITAPFRAIMKSFKR